MFGGDKAASAALQKREFFGGGFDAFDYRNFPMSPSVVLNFRRRARASLREDFFVFYHSRTTPLARQSV
jgi:hypothetical protein